MAHYMITLVIETDPAEGNPGRWDWQGMLDTPHPVTVMDYSPLPDDPTDEQVESLHGATVELHNIGYAMMTGDDNSMVTM